MKSHLPTIACLLLTALPALAADTLSAFPAPERGMVRHVLQPPPQADESLLKVELIVGKTVRLDADNRYFFGGRIAAQNISGWGYTKYVVSELGPLAGTLMAIDPQQPTVDRFVPLGGEPYLIRYNSRLPVVVYAPEDSEVRYRIWQTVTDAKAMPRQ